MNSSAIADTKASAMGVANAWVAAVNQQDLDAIVSNFATDSSFFGTSTKTLISDADSAVITGFDRWKVTVNGAPVEAIGRISMAVAVRNGQWRIVSFHRSTMPNWIVIDDEDVIIRENADVDSAYCLINWTCE